MKKKKKKKKSKRKIERERDRERERRDMSLSTRASNALVKRSQGTLGKEGGFTREVSSLFKPTIYSCTVVPQPRPLPEGALRCILEKRRGNWR